MRELDSEPPVPAFFKVQGTKLRARSNKININNGNDSPSSIARILTAMIAIMLVVEQ